MKNKKYSLHFFVSIVFLLFFPLQTKKHQRKKENNPKIIFFFMQIQIQKYQNSLATRTAHSVIKLAISSSSAAFFIFFLEQEKK